MVAKTYAALVAVSLSVGYLVGAQWSQRRFSKTASTDAPVLQKESADEREADIDSSSDEQPLEELGSVSAGLVEECKLVSSIWYLAEMKISIQSTSSE